MRKGRRFYRASGFRKLKWQGKLHQLYQIVERTVEDELEVALESICGRCLFGCQSIRLIIVSRFIQSTRTTDNVQILIVCITQWFSTLTNRIFRTCNSLLFILNIKKMYLKKQLSLKFYNVLKPRYKVICTFSTLLVLNISGTSKYSYLILTYHVVVIQKYNLRTVVQYSKFSLLKISHTDGKLSILGRIFKETIFLCWPQQKYSEIMEQSLETHAYPNLFTTCLLQRPACAFCSGGNPQSYVIKMAAGSSTWKNNVINTLLYLYLWGSI